MLVLGVFRPVAGFVCAPRVRVRAGSCAFVIPVWLPLPRVAARWRAAAPFEPPCTGVKPCSVPDALRLPAFEPSLPLLSPALTFALPEPPPLELDDFVAPAPSPSSAE